MDPTIDWFYQIRLIRPKSLYFEKKNKIALRIFPEMKTLKKEWYVLCVCSQWRM